MYTAAPVQYSVLFTFIHAVAITSMVVVKREGYESKSESCSEQDDDCSRDISTELKKASDSPITKV